jgi:SagB-type dehydrogenase family enzyme
MANKDALCQSSLIPAFENDDYSIVEIFHEYSKLNAENVLALGQRTLLAKTDAAVRAMTARSWKTYRGHPQKVLPAPSLPSVTLEDVVRRRRSLSSVPGAAFSDENMTLEQLSGILGMSYGISRSQSGPPTEEQRLRMTASAGALYPLEIYPIVFRVEGLDEGIYHYRVVDHSLELIRPGPCHSEFIQTTTYPDLCNKAAVALAITAVFQRSLWKYMNRGYRFVMNDAGALIQSLYLMGTAFQLGTFALGGFFDDQVGELLGINNVDECPVICFLLGRVAGM